jgi:hypothetical protein
MTGWLFLWSQQENLACAFQNQFFLAQLLPLCAFYWLYKATKQEQNSFYFLIACLFGLASVFTMANGIFALPLMAFYAFVTKQNKLRIGVIISLAVVSISFYFYDYHSNNSNGSWEQILHDPLSLVNYLLNYLGNPFSYLFQYKPCAWFAGLFFVINSIILAIRLLPQSKASLHLVLLFFIFYVEATAFSTGYGRVALGWDQALSSRYTTPSVMGWTALFILYLPTVLATLSARYKVVWTGLYTVLTLFFTTIMLSSQWDALKPNEGVLERNLAALALIMDVKDLHQIGTIFFSIPQLLPIVKNASEQNLSFFGLYPFREARYLGRYVPPSELSTCKYGELTRITALEEDARFLRIGGWLAHPKTHPQIIRFLNDEHKIIGYAMTAQKDSKVRYEGYILADQLGKGLLLQEDGASCQMPVLDSVLENYSKDKVSEATHCEGYIDALNGHSMPSSFSAKEFLNIQGWLLKVVDFKTQVPESVLIVLTDKNGTHIFIKTRVVSRPDVSAHFKNPGLDASGYICVADISGIIGNYTLRLAYTEGDQIKICPQFKIAGTFEPQSRVPEVLG